MIVITTPRRIGELGRHLLKTGRGANKEVVIRADMIRDVPADTRLALRVMAALARRNRRVKNLHIGVFLVFLVVAAAALFWIIVKPSIWSYDRLGALRVRTHRFTGALQVDTGSGWRTPPEPRDSNATPTAAELAKVKIKEVAWGPVGLLGGRIYNDSDRPIIGKIVLYVVIRDKGGEKIADRELRKSVEWPSHQESIFLIKSGLTTPGPTDKTKLELRSIH